jgi:hypothetical protein
MTNNVADAHILVRNTFLEKLGSENLFSSIIRKADQYDISYFREVFHLYSKILEDTTTMIGINDPNNHYIRRNVRCILL